MCPCEKITECSHEKVAVLDMGALPYIGDEFRYRLICPDCGGATPWRRDPWQLHPSEIGLKEKLYYGG